MFALPGKEAELKGRRERGKTWYWQVEVSQEFIYSMSKYCLSIYYTPGPVLDVEDIAVNKIGISNLMKFSFKRERQEIKMTIKKKLKWQSYNNTLWISEIYCTYTLIHKAEWREDRECGREMPVWARLTGACAGVGDLHHESSIWARSCRWRHELWYLGKEYSETNQEAAAADSVSDGGGERLRLEWGVSGQVGPWGTLKGFKLFLWVKWGDTGGS